jgi:hypothetical protein
LGVKAVSLASTKATKYTKTVFTKLKNDDSLYFTEERTDTELLGQELAVWL